MTHLHERPLDLSVRRSTLAEPSSTDGIDLIHEDDTRLVLSRVGEHLPDKTSRLSNVLVNNLSSAASALIQTSWTHS